MRNIKIIAAILSLSALISVGLPVVIKAETNNIGPVVKFTQDKNDSMLINHNFKNDEKMLAAKDTNMDPGFYIPNNSK